MHVLMLLFWIIAGASAEDNSLALLHALPHHELHLDTVMNSSGREIEQGFELRYSCHSRHVFLPPVLPALPMPEDCVCLLAPMSSPVNSPSTSS